MHLPVFEFERERIGVSLLRDKIGNIKALLFAEHGRVDIYPLARSHDLLVELAEHRRGTEKHTAKTRNRNEELSDSEHCDTDSGGRVAVYTCRADGTPGTLIRVTGIYTNLLPENDALRIKRGLVVNSPRELDLLLEDLGE